MEGKNTLEPQKYERPSRGAHHPLHGTGVSLDSLQINRHRTKFPWDKQSWRTQNTMRSSPYLRRADQAEISFLLTRVLKKGVVRECRKLPSALLESRFHHNGCRCCFDQTLAREIL